MSRAEKASEPSMEEILASIRKIISEEPASALSNGPASTQVGVTADRQPSVPIASETKGPGLMSSLGQVVPVQPSIDQSSRGQPVVMQPVATQPAPAGGQNVAGTSVASASPSAAASLDDILGMADGAGGATPAQQTPSNAQVSQAVPPERAPVQLSFPPQSRDLPPFGNSLPPGPGAAAATDFRAVVPSRSETSRPFEPQVGAPRFADIRPDNPMAGRGAGVSLRAQPAPAASTGLSGTSFNGSMAYPTPSTPVIKPVEPVAAKVSVPVTLDAAKPAVDTASKVAVEPKVAPAKADVPKVEPKVEMATPADALNVKSASPPAKTDADAMAAVAVNAAAPAARVAASAVLPAQAAAASAAGEPTRTMEDTVAELLRPMLRQWLDANMPRVVEKALRVELAASVQPKPTDAARN